MNVLIIGGSGKIALRLAKILSSNSHKVTSIVRSSSSESKITEVGSTPKILSLETTSAPEFTTYFDEVKPDVIYFSAGSGGKGGNERTENVDYKGAIKVFDAIEAMKDGKTTRLILVSAIASGNPEKIHERYPDPEDAALAQRSWDAIGYYMSAKYRADLDLSKRTSFSWIIIRPGGLIDDPPEGTGKVNVGRTKLGKICREDVAKVLAELVSREDAGGLAFDVVGGEGDVEIAVDRAIKKKVNAFDG